MEFEDKKFVMYKGNKYYLRKNGKEKRGYYIRTDRLHRAVWETEKGPIPEGFHIHHINGNTLDNRIENLECISQEKHHAIHFDSVRQLKKLHSPEVVERAHKWQKTPEGKEKLRRSSKKAWEKRRPIQLECVICKEKFSTLNFAGSKYCSQKCRCKSGYLARLSEKKCIICGKSFKTERGNTCSPTCGAHSAANTRRMRKSNDNVPAVN